MKFFSKVLYFLLLCIVAATMCASIGGSPSGINGMRAVACGRGRRPPPTNSTG
ncbi:hypothetical protein X777_12617 [Ooceraea biroi]|uniref:Transmembrane protein n=1 Tax=Ooceraea biroi TaxID=2015173 RepID=A0A026VZJ3_OOCBI|nr:hypothetical protein X777_12617 [Ooceraea biroi]